MFRLTRTAWALAALACCFVLFPSRAGAQESWTPVGLSTNSPMCAAVAPGNSSLIIAGGANLYVTTNGGGTWATKMAPTSVLSVVFGSNQNVAFAGCWGRRHLQEHGTGAQRGPSKTAGLAIRSSNPSVCCPPTTTPYTQQMSPDWTSRQTVELPGPPLQWSKRECCGSRAYQRKHDLFRKLGRRRVQVDQCGDLMDPANCRHRAN